MNKAELKREIFLSCFFNKKSPGKTGAKSKHTKKCRGIFIKFYAASLSIFCC